MRATTWLFYASVVMTLPCLNPASAQGIVLCNDTCQHLMGLDRPAQSPPAPAPAAEPAVREPLSLLPAAPEADGAAPVAERRKKRKPPREAATADQAPAADKADDPQRLTPRDDATKPVKPITQVKPIKPRTVAERRHDSKVAPDSVAPDSKVSPPPIPAVAPATSPAPRASATIVPKPAPPKVRPRAAMKAKPALPPTEPVVLTPASPAPAPAEKTSPSEAAPALVQAPPPTAPIAAPPPPVAASAVPPNAGPDEATATDLDAAPLLFIPQDAAHIIARSRREQREAMPDAAAALNDLDPNF